MKGCVAMGSLWSRTVHPPTFPALDRDLTTDVLIIGGGLAGVLCCHCLTRAGVDCALVEARTLCSGVTKDTTAKLTSQHGLIYQRLSAPPGRLSPTWRPWTNTGPCAGG